MRTFAILVAMFLVCSCQADLRRAGSLEPLGTNGFRWRTFADATFPNHSDKAEAARLAELANVLAMNGACRNGYEITGRHATLKQRGALGEIYDVFYDITCR
ncbi:hypothetical protein D2T31_04990 [Sinirhodobacter populi]|uniref:Uncharacterized protein n=1 Tax=Paenirhodobacter populi TaxID=2306993 RepID=A0A443KEV3_9RHOB|nr:hypothetical protein [Sinirhodobacter populi]RWR31357.1 hypothetical protein D2T31_04990 [Sinirhodobacter populi]